jgi:endonuclease/exonuclease/phosphatase (EEP) superfamily protein YafD
VVCCAATVLGFLGRLWWAFDLFAHFRVQYCLALGLIAAIFLARRRYGWSGLFGLFAAGNLWVVAPIYRTLPQGHGPPRTLHRALWVNVNTERGDPKRVAALIRHASPDVVVLGEVNQRWLTVLAPSLAAYPFSASKPRQDHFGIALYSRFPLTRSEIRYVGSAELPSVVVEVEAPGGRFTIVGTHPLPPVGPEQTRLRDEQLELLPAVVEVARSPVLLMGDLNATPWCYPFQRLLRESGLQDSSQGRGLQPTWPTFLPLLWIPIDHCLFGPGVRVTGKRVGPRVGSDHYPLLVEFGLE